MAILPEALPTNAAALIEMVRARRREGEAARGDADALLAWNKAARERAAQAAA